MALKVKAGRHLKEMCHLTLCSPVLDWLSPSRFFAGRESLRPFESISQSSDWQALFIVLSRTILHTVCAGAAVWLCFT